jgi:hypothetical protein
VNSAYVRKTNRASWSEENMEKAMDKVKAKEMSIGEASQYYDIPKSTLGRRVLGRNKVVKGSEKQLGRFNTTFDKLFEDELVRYVKDMESRFFGMTYMDLRKLAFQLAEKNKLVHQFNKAKGMAGKKWMRLFMRRQPSLSLRQPEATSYARATGFDKPKCGIWPLNEDVFTEADYSAAETTDRPVPVEVSSTAPVSNNTSPTHTGRLGLGLFIQ